MDKVLLEKYFKGEPCTPEELVSIEAFLKDPKSSDPFLYQEWKGAAGSVDPQESEAMWTGIMKGMPEEMFREDRLRGDRFQEERLLGEKVPDGKRLGTRRLLIASAAAAVTIVIIVTGIVLRQASPRLTAWRTIDNPSKDVKLIRLEDGSQIWLNAHSSLSVSELYQQKDRQVQLKGEAFFDVTQDPKRPFIVHTGRLRTTVLGTTFDIRAWPSLSPIQVALVSGKVRVNTDGNDSLILAPGDQLDFDTVSNRLALQHNAVHDDRVGWTNGKIVLDNTALPEILRQIEQIYHVSIDNKMTMANAGNIKLSGQFRRDPIDQVLKNLLFPINLDFTYEHGVYIIHQIKDKKSLLSGSKPVQ